MARVFTLRILILLLSAFAGVDAWAQCPTAASCTPGSASNSNASFALAGIYSVRFGNQAASTSQGYTEGYVDNSCTTGRTLLQGLADSLVVRNGVRVPENVRVYVDWNNNGVLDATTELAAASAAAAFVHRFTITAPGSAVLNQKLRVRIASDADLGAPLPGPCTTPQYSQTEDYYVEVQANTQPPVANFVTADTISCNGTVTFRDLSTNTPTGWRWDFGDNSSATGQNPIHIYASTGRYTVTLIATNANGSDTLVRPNYVYFNDTVPVAANCTPTTQQYCCNYGITRFTLKDEHGNNLINNATANGQAGYENFTCSIRGRIIEGRPYTFAVTTNPDQDQNTKIWIDFNNDGIFRDSTELVFTKLATRNPSDTISLLVGPGGQRNKPLRMRVMSDGGSGTINACTNPQLGQAEDYTVVMLENTLPPVADFVRVNATGCDSVAQFVASPENAVSSFVWDFGDGNIDTTTTTGITHTYQDFGVYTVTLVVIGPFGRDTLVRNNLVNYLDSPQPATCAVPTLRAGAGVGIRRVQIADIDKSSQDAQTEGYQDYTCEATTTLKKSKAYPITVTTGPNNRESVGIWIDFNNNAEFSPDEKVFTADGVQTHTGSLAPMPASVVMLTALRMRVVSRLPFQGQETQPCGTVDFGQAEDYTVVVVPNLDPPVAAFSSQRSTCNGNIAFYDSTQNDVKSWLWKFGDGDTSTLQNPVHFYANPGTYTVTLVVRNDFGVDSIVKQDQVTIFTNLNIAAATCQPNTVQNCCGFGITRVRLNTIDNLSGDGSESYQDYSCSSVTRLVKGSRYALRVNTNPVNAENLRAWIDWNSDGSFDATEIIGTSLGQRDTHYISFTIPATGMESRGLRMRLMSDNIGNQTLDPCTPVNLGQVEDYAVVLDTNTFAPDAIFGAAANTTCNGFVQFRDSSSSVPTSYVWDFGDNTTSSLQNPLKKYTATGTYTIKLKVSNAFGSDSLVRQNYVTVTGTDGVRPAACTPLRTAYCCGAGITRVQFANLDNISTNGSIQEYQDFTCATRPTLLVGAGTPITVTLARGFNEKVSGWVDWNDDSTFTDDERVVTTPTNNNLNTVRDTIVPPAGAVLGKALRFRLVSAFGNPPQPGPDPVACGTYANGQVEDYSLMVNALPPQANFYTMGTGSCNGTVKFVDSTVNGATTWHWYFGDNTESTAQSPVHQYAATGTFTVKLVVTNPLGQDSVEKTNYVTIDGFRGPRAPVCYPQSILSAGIISGVTGFTLNNTRLASRFTQTSGTSVEGYRDFSCVDSIMAAVGDQITVSATAGSTASRTQFLVIALDANNDGVFANTEQVLGGALQVGQIFNGQFRIPNSTIGNRVRVRVTARATGTAAGTCDVQDGQSEDYSVVIVPMSTAKPVYRNLTVYPNPASSILKIQLPEDVSGAITPEVVDGLGRVVLRHKATAAGSVLELPVSILAEGFYTLRLVTPHTLYTAPISISR